MSTKSKQLTITSFQKQKKAFVEMQMNASDIRTKLILLLVANTMDPTIGEGCKTDMTAIRELFAKLSVEMDFNFIELVIQGKDYGKESIMDGINALSPGSNDIVVFYYSGHGFSYEKNERKIFPQVDLRALPASDKIDVVNAYTENLSDLFNLIKARGARLNIVIGDCCNNLIDFRRKAKGGSSVFLNEKKQPVVVNKKTAEVLFCDYTASILIASASKGEYAVSDDELGSLFTYNFSESLKKIMKKDIDKNQGLPWEKLLKETSRNALKLSKTYDIGGGVPGSQKAIYNIEFRKTLY